MGPGIWNIRLPAQIMAQTTNESVYLHERFMFRLSLCATALMLLITDQPTLTGARKWLGLSMAQKRIFMC